MSAWLESMNDEESTGDENLIFDDEVEYSNPEFGLTPEQQRKVDSIMQQLYDGTDEYRRLMEIVMADIPNWTPEFGEQQDQARERMFELDNDLPQLLTQYYFVTRDMESLEQLLPLFKGIMK